MSDIEKRARELLKSECRDLRDEAFEYGSMMTVINLHVVMRALRTALTPPAGYVLVPVEPTEAMRDVLLDMLTNCHTVTESYDQLIAVRPEVL
ncbi:hypothetical protein [Stenotrophomonas sp. 278]|uniref:hypothetical protein n=1 Tax=Stenotrophomonas sp. 278 TaxID=2479851 RepID=UPI000F68C35D|nr:hypothetical protein [Stenotrophomonas sp. 278]RRU17841.1 hypothetical protein EGJ34_06805 [Stenotrophomonas sp. 278]